MNSACLHLVVDSSLFWLRSLRWVMSESSHSQLSFWIKLFSAFLDLHKVLRCSLSIFWWSSSDCLCSVWCVHYVLVSRSFYALRALSLRFSSLMSESFLKLLELSNSSCEVQCFRFQACEATLLNLVASSTRLQFLERSDQSISFVSLSFLFSSLFSLESRVSCEVMTDHLWIAASQLLLLLLLHWLMMMFWMWNMYFLMFVIVY